MSYALRASLVAASITTFTLYTPLASALQIAASSPIKGGTMQIQLIPDPGETAESCSYTVGNIQEICSTTGVSNVSIPSNTTADSVEVTATSSDGNGITQRFPIVNNDNPSNGITVGFTQTQVQVNKGGTATVRVERSGSGDGTTVDYEVVAGSAKEGTDYSVSGDSTLVWDEGDTSKKEIRIDILPGATEGNKFTVRLKDPEGAQIASNNEVAVVISSSAKPDDGRVGPGTQPVVERICENKYYEPGSQLEQNCRGIKTLSPEKQKELYRSITPSQNATPNSYTVKVAGAQTRSLQNRLSSLRATQTTKALSASFNGFSITGKQGGSSGEDEFKLSDGRLGFFFQGKYQASDRSTQTNSSNTVIQDGFQSNLYNLTMGTDYRISDQMILGVSLAYDNIDLVLSADRGSQKVDAIRGMVYGSYYLPHDFYVDLVAGYGGQNYISQRTSLQYFDANKVQYYNGRTKGTPGGNQYNVSLNLGKDFGYDAWVLSPYTRFEFLTVDMDSYKESGTTGWETKYDKQTTESMTTTAGAKATYSFSLPWGILTPGMRFEWLHEFSNNSYGTGGTIMQATRDGYGENLSMTFSPDRDYFNIEGSLVASLPEGKSAFLRYESRLGQSYISSHTVEAGIRIPF